MGTYETGYSANETGNFFRWNISQFELNGNVLLNLKIFRIICTCVKFLKIHLLLVQRQYSIVFCKTFNTKYCGPVAPV